MKVCFAFKIVEKRNNFSIATKPFLYVLWTSPFASSNASPTQHRARQPQYQKCPGESCTGSNGEKKTPFFKINNQKTPNPSNSIHLFKCILVWWHQPPQPNKLGHLHFAIRNSVIHPLFKWVLPLKVRLGLYITLNIFVVVLYEISHSWGQSVAVIRRELHGE